jgi:pimeloyl-ACP methyl ester carboxylesterase
MMKILDPLILSDQGPLLLHAHANGYPPEVYRAFLEPFLDTYQVRAIYLRPFWPGSTPDGLNDWRIFRDDYLAALPSLPKAAGGQPGLIGMGHSLGAMTTLMAAIEKPEKFRALVLIEPTLFPAWMGYLMRGLAPLHVYRYLHPLIRRTLRRKTSFPDQESMYQNYRKKGIFAAIPDDVLRDYVRGLASPAADGTVGLQYSPEWEAQVYETGGSADRYVWKNLAGIPCPVLVIRGEQSDTLADKTLERITRRLPRGKAVTIPEVGHLLPLESPRRVAAVVLDFLESVL